MSRLKNSGFAAIETVLVIVVIGILGFTGWFVWQAKQNTDASLDAANNSQQVPSTAKKVDTTSQKSSEDATKTWTSVASKNDGFTVRVPDGWKGVNYNGADQLRFTAIDYVAGTKAEITEAASPYAGDSEVPVSIELHHTAGPDQALIADATITDFKLGNYPYDGTRFYKLHSQSTPQGVGARYKGDADYAYRVDIAKDKVLYAYYSLKAGQSDQHELVEQMLATNKINQ